jgi:hypothetical protein
MKKMVKTTGIVLMLLMAGTLTLAAQQNMRGMRMDTTRMHRMMMNPGQRHMMMNQDSMPMRGMQKGMSYGRNVYGMQRGICQCPMMKGMMPQGMDMPRHGLGMGPGMQGMMHQRMILENIPNLTDKQKKDIAVMRIDQQTEMQKFRDEMQSKMKVIRETQKANIEKLLTPDQKKWLDENAPEPEGKPTPGIPLSKAPAISK